MKLQYGKKGSAYGVRPGDVWAVGSHLLACGDLEDGAGARFLAWARAATEKEPALFYCDPPWSPAFVTRFRQGAGAEQKPEHTVASLVQCIAALAAPQPLFLEMGVTFSGDCVRQWLASAYPERVHNWPITYSGKPATLYAAGLPGPFRLAFEGQDDTLTPSMAMLECTEPGQVVVDLCLGLGQTSRAASELRRHCWGLELHPRRVSSALVDLAKLTGQQPMNIGHI